ncbi:MAG TPA: hypothetical protein VLW25_03790 [Bryobacteraceae bacterium]|nr:hypothetical protein [Bryobacteraceae bacterium]
MKRTMILALAAASFAFAQPEPRHLAVTAGVGGAFMQIGPGATVQGAPYSATIVNESTQTLADGNRIVQRATGNTARDSQGRTRQDMALPSIGNMSAANAPHLVFIQDPVAQTAYTLNLTDKTAHKMPALPPGPPGAVQGQFQAGVISAAIPPPSVAIANAGVPGPGAVVMKEQIGLEQGDIKTEGLGTQTMQGVSAQGVRTTRTIPAGQIGNDNPIEIVTEVWTSPELKTIVYSKRSDPRTGEQIFQLTNIVRSEPDPSLFTVPSDFKLEEGPEGKRDVIFYRPNG